MLRRTARKKVVLAGDGEEARSSLADVDEGDAADVDEGDPAAVDEGDPAAVSEGDAAAVAMKIASTLSRTVLWAAGRS